MFTKAEAYIPIHLSNTNPVRRKNKTYQPAKRIIKKWVQVKIKRQYSDKYSEWPVNLGRKMLCTDGFRAFYFVVFSCFLLPKNLVLARSVFLKSCKCLKRMELQHLRMFLPKTLYCFATHNNFGNLLSPQTCTPELKCKS